jgi:hypothetical protein
MPQCHFVIPCRRRTIVASACFALTSNTLVYAQQRVHVDQSSTAVNPEGDSWATSYNFISEGIAQAVFLSNDGTIPVEVWIAAGTYRPDEDSANPTGDGEVDKSFSMHNNIRLYGGFLGLNYPGGGETAKN